MTSVAVSPKFQIVIPKAIREALKLRPGQRVDVRLDGAGRVVVEPELDIRSARGFLPPIPGVDLAQVTSDPEGPDWPGGCEPLPDAPWVRASDPGDKP
ncbi:AbrB/MazE/SpoVT family DNA-binding domain-containing protein [Leptothrix sp. BB-4]